MLFASSGIAIECDVNVSRFLTSASLVIRNPNGANKIVVIYRVVLLIILWSLLVQRYYFNLQSHCSVCRLRSVLPYKQQR